MESLSALDKNVLIDMLAEYTSKYTRMLTEGSDDTEYARCKLMIAALQQEIETRQKDFESNSTQTNQPPQFE